MIYCLKPKMGLIFESKLQIFMEEFLFCCGYWNVVLNARKPSQCHPQTIHLKIPLADPLPKFLKELFFAIPQIKRSNNLRLMLF
ncbi:hypothetical protein EGI22_11660 [Lacihabitans sp. LS3-19]|nr:hypothetical protein [Lacihabitans sp. LS3-19]